MCDLILETLEPRRANMSEMLHSLLVYRLVNIQGHLEMHWMAQ